MVINKKPKEINPNTINSELKSIPTTTKTGSPTTGNSGLVSAKRTRTGTKTARQKLNVSSAKDNTELRVSQKRMLANNLIRTLDKHQSTLDRVLKTIINRNQLQDPVKQDLCYSIEVNKDNQSIMKFTYNYLGTLPDPMLITELKKNIKNIEVTAFPDPAPGTTTFFVRTVKPTTK